jgi:hypothetical protein
MRTRALVQHSPQCSVVHSDGLEPGITRDLHPEYANNEFGNSDILGTIDAKWQVFGCRQYPLFGVSQTDSGILGRPRLHSLEANDRHGNNQMIRRILMASLCLAGLCDSHTAPAEAHGTVVND